MSGVGVDSTALASVRAHKPPWTLSNERWIFIGLLIVSVLPILAFEHFPSEDGALHLANASVYVDSGSPIISEYYVFRGFPPPNVVGDLVLAMLLLVFPASLAVKVFALIIALAFPLLFRLCISYLRSGSEWMAALSIPLGQGFLLYSGFFNFALGVVLALAAFAFWAGFLFDRNDRTPGRWLLFSVIGLLVYFSHPMPSLLLMMLIGAELWSRYRMKEGPTRSYREWWTAEIRPLLLPLGLPLALLVAFMLGSSGAVGFGASIAYRLYLLPGYVVRSLSTLELPFAYLHSVALVLLVAAALVHNPRGRRLGYFGFLLAAFLLFALYLLGPTRLGEGSVILPRIALFGAIVLLCWLTRAVIRPRIAVVGLLVGAIVVVGLTAVRIPAHAVLSEDIDEYLSGEEVLRPNSTVLPLFASEIEEGRGLGGEGRQIRPLIELAGALTHSSRVVDLHHLPGALDIFPFRFAEDRNIRETAEEGDGWPFQFGPALVDIDEFMAMGGRVDYIWLWGRPARGGEALESVAVTNLLATIEEDYRLAFKSDGGRLAVYEREATS